MDLFFPGTQIKMPNILSVNEIFIFDYEESEGIGKKCAIEIKVLKKISATKFVIGDEKGTCVMKIDPNFSGSDVLAENHCYQIHYDKSNIEENTLVLRKNVKILESSWKVRVPVQIIAKANISHDVEKVSFCSLSSEIVFLYSCLLL